MTARDRIAAVIYDSFDDYAKKLLVKPHLPGAADIEGDGKPFCYRVADALIAAGVTMPTSEQRGDGCTHNHITMEIHLPSRGKNLFFGVAFNDDHIDEEHIAMWWDDTLGRLKQTAMETLEREGILESVEP